MAYKMRFKKVRHLFFILMLSWLMVGWPPIWQNPRIPLEAPTASAATQTFTTSGQWQAPADVSSVTVELWAGGGGGGGRGSSNGSSGGGGGGAYATRTINVTSGQIYNYTVGTGGNGGSGTSNGSDGNPSQWEDGSSIKAAGGKGGAATTTKGLGGATADSVGSLTYKGGDGADGTGTVSGGGGGGAGSTGAGGNATNGTAGTGTSLSGGDGGTGVTNADGNPGSVAGGGGSGARRTNGNRGGGSGARGQVKITYAIISITVGDGIIAYGILGVNSTKDTTSSGANDTQTATNTGDAAEDFNIKGQSSASWTLAGSVGSEQYKHEFCTTGSGSPDPCDTDPTWTALTTSYQSLASNISVSGTKKFDLKVSTPTSTNATAQQSVDIIVQAVAH